MRWTEEALMSDLGAVEIKAFVPARDFALSKRFYEDLGFTIKWSDSDLAYLHCGDCSFLLQNFYNPEHAGNFMMHLLVADVEAWWHHVEESQLAAKYDVRARMIVPGVCATSRLSTQRACSGALRKTPDGRLSAGSVKRASQLGAL
jgi:hypothetical protein